MAQVSIYDPLENNVVLLHIAFMFYKSAHFLYQVHDIGTTFVANYGSTRK